ncbi:hypothetical protein AB0M02_26390 [Actinoplanes sp. NPDC051861]|uniref:hypothetical protein n=1 Tax=Actinoplanes sp. NPDC051861 TaxID=3155170 RepID=UPI003417B575
MPDEPQESTSRRWFTAADLVVLAGVLLLVLFVPAAAISAALLPVPPSFDAEAVPLPANASTATLRALPSGGAEDSLEDAAVAALGADGARALLKRLPQESYLQDATPRDADGAGVYPYRYQEMNRLLDAAPQSGRTAQTARLGATLLVRAAKPVGSRFDYDRANAAAAAFAMLERAREAGGCDAQLNLLLMVSADMLPRDRVVRDEVAAAEKACPGDPTPLWIYGQYLSQRAARVIQFKVGDLIPADATQQAAAAFDRLAREFPGSVPALTGVADGHLREGMRLISAKPFTARSHLRIAESHYLAARDLDPSAAVPGLAATLIALGEPDRAASLVRNAAAGPLLELLTTAQEAAHRFDQAAATARSLLTIGPRGYPSGDQLFPVPGSMEEVLPQDPAGPLSAGVVTALPFTVDLQVIPGGAGGEVEDTSFVPAYRPGGVIGSDPDCPALGWRRDAILAGHVRSADVLLADGVRAEPVRPGGGCSLRADILRDIVMLETGRQIDTSRREWVGDEWQNLYRWAGDLPRAEKAARVWAGGGSAEQPLPWLRLGEVLFLQGRFEEAAGAYAGAARRTRASNWNNDTGVTQALLGQGASLLRTSRSAEGMTILRDVAAAAEQGAAFQRQTGDENKPDQGYARQFALVAYHARAQLADAARGAGTPRAALEDYAAARELLPHLDGRVLLRPERLDANQALAEIELGSFAAASESIARALTVDPLNPAFLMTAGFAADRAGHWQAAARFNSAALSNDPGAFPAANDLGVALARLGRHDAAADAFRRSVGARPDYALGWFNLGVVSSFVPAQGAFARAFALDPSLRDAPRVPTTDVRIYRTGIDLSKPLPGRWSLAGLPPLSPAPATGLLAVLVLGLTLARAAGAGAQSSAQQWLETIVDRWPLLGRLRHPAWALALTVTIFVVRGPESPIFLAFGVLLLAMVALRSRAFVARRAGISLTQESWGPGMAFGALTAVFAPWAPLPVTRPASAVPRVHTVAPVALGLLALVLFLETAAFGVPVISALATSALVMVASVLVPVAPLDGAEIDKAGLVAGAGVLGAAVLMGLSLA